MELDNFSVAWGKVESSLSVMKEKVDALEERIGIMERKFDLLIVRTFGIVLLLWGMFKFVSKFWPLP